MSPSALAAPAGLGLAPKKLAMLVCLADFICHPNLGERAASALGRRWWEAGPAQMSFASEGIAAEARECRL